MTRIALGKLLGVKLKKVSKEESPMHFEDGQGNRVGESDMFQGEWHYLITVEEHFRFPLHRCLPKLHIDDDAGFLAQEVDGA